uniref:Uncharacterized protein n=1 Tax=Clastoptera arizonana TaxID=38151 RepID=A0A1B6D8X0_9HEMI
MYKFHTNYTIYKKIIFSLTISVIKMVSDTDQMDAFLVLIKQLEDCEKNIKECTLSDENRTRFQDYQKPYTSLLLLRKKSCIFSQKDCNFFGRICNQHEYIPV